MKKSKTEKIYCYVDETGQDTSGKLYIVVSVIVGSEKTAIEVFLNACEAKSGRYKQKWQKSRHKDRKRYIELALAAALLRDKIYYKKCLDSKKYVELTARVIIESIRDYIQKHKIIDGNITIVIDGLNMQEKLITTRMIRKSLIKTKKIRGMRDQSSPLIRLADTVCGMLRDAGEGNEGWRSVVARLKKDGVIDEIL